MSDSAGAALSGAWRPPAMSGPVVTFRGKRPDAAEVEHEAQRATREGFERGRADGLAAAAQEISQLRRRLQQQCAAVEQVLQQMARPLERMDAGATRELVQLALRIGAELAAKELRAEPERILQIVEKTLQHLPSAHREVRLLMHPLDFSAVNSTNSQAMQDCGWRLLADPQVKRGGCRVLLDSSEIDAEFDVRLAAVIERLFADAPPSPQGDVTAELAAERGEL